MVPHRRTRCSTRWPGWAPPASCRSAEGTRYAGSFRAHGLLVPVWDLPVDEPAAAWAEPAAAFADRLAGALAADRPLTPAERRARDGIRGRQLTLR